MTKKKTPDSESGLESLPNTTPKSEEKKPDVDTDETPVSDAVSDVVETNSGTADADAHIAELQAQLDTQITERDAERDRLKSSKDDIIREKREQTQRAQELQTEVETLRGDLSTREGELATLLRNSETHVAGIQEEANKRVSDLEERLNGLQIENAITRELANYSLMPGAVSMAERQLRESAELKDGCIAVGGKPVSEAVKEWSISPEGKLFIRSLNVGGGMKHNGKPTIERTANPFRKGAEFNLTKQGEIVNSDPALADRLRREAGLQ